MSKPIKTIKTSDKPDLYITHTPLVLGESKTVTYPVTITPSGMLSLTSPRGQGTLTLHERKNWNENRTDVNFEQRGKSWRTRVHVPSIYGRRDKPIAFRKEGWSLSPDLQLYLDNLLAQRLLAEDYRKARFAVNVERTTFVASAYEARREAQRTYDTASNQVKWTSIPLDVEALAAKAVAYRNALVAEDCAHLEAATLYPMPEPPAGLED